MSSRFSRIPDALIRPPCASFAAFLPYSEDCERREMCVPLQMWRLLLPMRRLPFQEFPATDSTNKLPVLYRNLATHGHNARPAFDLPVFERVVVDILRLRLDREFAPVIRIVDH